MELIPVFSLIVLVATAGTFILAVGAYVMYKLREKRERRDGPSRAIPSQQSIEAEVHTPKLYVVNQQAQTPPQRGAAREFPPEGYGPAPSNPHEEQKTWR